MSFLKLIWRFSRPHTLIGTGVSITTLFVLGSEQALRWPSSFWLALISAFGCNIFITGYNQLVDIELDRINKPNLPLADGSLSVKQAKIIVGIALAISLLTAGIASLGLLALVIVISLIGFIYSWKSVYLKKSHPLAALAITTVRGVLVNLGFYMYFAELSSLDQIPLGIWLLASFVVLFSLGISWFKDIPDVEGDAQASVGSLALKMGVSKTFNLGVISVSLAYSLCAFIPLFADLAPLNPSVIALGSGFGGLIFLSYARRTQPLLKSSMQRFYMVFWVLFAAAYLVFGLSVVV